MRRVSMLLPVTCLPLTACLYALPPGPSDAGVGYWPRVDTGLLAGPLVPTGRFGEVVGNPATGVLTVGVNFGRSRRFGVRADVMGTQYGRNERAVSLGVIDPLLSGDGKVVTVNEFVGVTAGAHAALFDKPVRVTPFAAAGPAFFTTSTRLEIDDVDDPVSQTNLDDQGPVWALGTDVWIPLTRQRGAKWAVVVRAVRHHTGTVEYLAKDLVTVLPDGTAILRPRRSATDMWLFAVGISFGWDRNMCIGECH